MTQIVCTIYKKNNKKCKYRQNDANKNCRLNTFSRSIINLHLFLNHDNAPYLCSKHPVNRKLPRFYFWLKILWRITLTHKLLYFKELNILITLQIVKEKEVRFFISVIIGSSLNSGGEKLMLFRDSFLQHLFKSYFNWPNFMKSSWCCVICLQSNLLLVVLPRRIASITDTARGLGNFP